MTELLLNQEKEVNSCLQAHIIQLANACAITDKMIDLKKIFGILFLLMNYESFLFCINKENLELLRKTLDSIITLLAETKNMINDNYRSSLETHIKKINIIFFSNSKKTVANNNKKDLEQSNEEEEKYLSEQKPMPISKGTLKNFKDILEN